MLREPALPSYPNSLLHPSIRPSLSPADGFRTPGSPPPSPHPRGFSGRRGEERGAPRGGKWR